jgi:GxxExxY protein
MAIESLKYNELTGKIIGCAMRVHSAIKPGLKEVIYQRALFIEFEEQQLQFASEIETSIRYKNKIIGKHRCDLIVEDKIIIELKALPFFDKNGVSQLATYLELFDKEVGLLLNFGLKSLEFKRVINSKATSAKS